MKIYIIVVFINIAGRFFNCLNKEMGNVNVWVGGIIVLKDNIQPNKHE